MKISIKFGIIVLLVLGIQFALIPVPKAYAYSNPATVPLGTVSNFAALAASTVTSPTGPTILNNGDMGTNLDCTDFPTPCDAPNVNGTITNGTVHRADGTATTGQTDATAAVTNIGLRTSDETLAGGLLDNLTLTQGVYTIPAATTNLTGDLTLNGDANSVFIFHATSTLITATGSRVLLTGGAQACNVFWKVDSSATFNGATTMVGTVLAQASVTFPGGGATLAGRVVAQTAAITFNNTTINNSSCATTTTASTTSSTTVADAAAAAAAKTAAAAEATKAAAAAATAAAADTAALAAAATTSTTKLPNTGLFNQNVPLATAVGAVVLALGVGVGTGLFMSSKKRKPKA